MSVSARPTDLSFWRAIVFSILDDMFCLLLRAELFNGQEDYLETSQRESRDHVLMHLVEK